MIVLECTPLHPTAALVLVVVIKMLCYNLVPHLYNGAVGAACARDLTALGVSAKKKVTRRAHRRPIATPACALDVAACGCNKEGRALHTEVPACCRRVKVRLRFVTPRADH